MRYTLVSDGSGDRVLLPVLDWLLFTNSRHDFSGLWADLRRLPHTPRTLRDRIGAAISLYPCDLLFVHRDAEGKPRSDRVREIERALGGVAPAICVIPIRMQEAWFLFNEPAIRIAAGNPSGRKKLFLPKLSQTEAAAQPKKLLYAALRAASELKGRRLRNFGDSERAHHLARLIDDFSPLRALSAFSTLEQELKAVLADHSWD